MLEGWELPPGREAAPLPMASPRCVLRVCTNACVLTCRCARGVGVHSGRGVHGGVHPFWVWHGGGCAVGRWAVSGVHPCADVHPWRCKHVLPAYAPGPGIPSKPPWPLLAPPCPRALTLVTDLTPAPQVPS